jgi:hypothetical protein
LEGLRFEDFDMFYGHLECFTDIWDIYNHLVHFVFIWYIFSGFGIMHQEKSGNPALEAKKVAGSNISISFISPTFIFCRHPSVTEITERQVCQMFLVQPTKTGKI